VYLSALPVLDTYDYIFTVSGIALIVFGTWLLINPKPFNEYTTRMYENSPVFQKIGVLREYLRSPSRGRVYGATMMAVGILFLCFEWLSLPMKR